MTDVEIYQRLTGIFREVFDDESIVLGPQTAAHDIAAWDSLNHVILVVAIEQAFGIKFHSAEIEGLQDVGGMVSLIERELAAKHV